MSFKIALVGEAWGEAEEQYKRPFVGPAGQELNRMLSDAGISRDECFVTNVFNFRPRGNDLVSLCQPRSACGNKYPWPSLVRGLYLKEEYFAEITRLREELTSVSPNLIVALGNTAVWALLGNSLISKIRGTLFQSTLVPGLKVLPTYHPAAVLRQYELRHVTVMDLIKAKAESEFPEIRRPLREIWLEPDLLDIGRFYAEYVQDAKELAFDIETASGQITCIGFAPSIERAICIPFVDFRKPGNSYWPTLQEELQAWKAVQKFLSSSSTKVAQNGLYDIQYLWMAYGLSVTNFTEDTMLLHHSLQPESPKSLDFLGSVYTNEVAWKTLRPRGKKTIKKDN